MGAQKSIHAGNAKIDFNVDLTHKLCAALMLSPFRNSGSPLSLIIGSLYIKHHNLFGRSEKLDVSWDKGLDESSVFIAYRKPRPEWLPQQSFTIQHSISPEIGVHGLPVENFSRSGSGGVNLCRFCIGLDLNEPASSHWSSKTSIKFEHVRPVNDDGRSISKDLAGFPVTCSGSCHDSMVVLKQESQFAKEYDRGFDRLSLQIEQGIPVQSKWLIFNRFKFLASKGISLGPAFLLTSLTGGSIVGDIAPYQAFAIGGLGSVRGYGEGAIGSGRSFLVANSELTFPLGMIPQQTRRYRGTTVSMVFLSSHFMHSLPKVRSVSNPSVSVVFWEQPLRAFIAKESDVRRCYFLGLWNRFVLWSSCSRDMANSATQQFEEKQRKVGERSHLRVPFVYEGNPSLRHGKPGNGIGLGYSLRFKSHYGNFQVDYAINAFHQERVSFSFGKLAS